MSMFDGAQDINIRGGHFSIVMGNVFYELQNDGQQIFPEPKPVPKPTHIFKETSKLTQPGYSPDGAVFSDDGIRVVAVSCKDPTVLIWAVESTTEIVLKDSPLSHRLTEDPSSWASFALLSPDGKRVALGPISVARPHTLGFVERVTTANAITLWDSVTGTVSRLKDDAGPFEYAAFSPRGDKLVTGSYHYIRIWDLLSQDEGVQGIGHFGAIFPVAFSPDGKWVASVGSYDKRILIWDAETVVLEYGPHTEYSQEMKADVKTLAFSPDGSRLAVGFEDGKIILMEVETGVIISQLMHFMGHAAWITCIVFSRDGKWMVSSSRDMSIRVWNVDTGLPISKPLKGHTGAVLTVADEKKIISSSQDDTIRVWSLQ
ncbi:Vegetative incompatibility protein HET-E-1 [Hypsizygus marmoreus]|uniref:Vegetative incompatibility protein HET-E-1 n=1 Tax=Hypsizygus marmoreus TaxID=39966 RepID=A0A369JUV1_HYPMA|nr:Vegetative incompatibility protein HET-E-1 [Hypsizygus marmoreus]